MKKLLLLLLLPSLALAKPKVVAPEPVSLRPFVGADLVWSVRGPAALGPDSGPAIEHALTQPADLTKDCQVGDLSLQADRVEITLKCGGVEHKLVAQLRAGSSPFEVLPPTPSTDVLAAAQLELQHRLDTHATEIPLRHPAAKPTEGLPELAGALGHWQRAADAMLVGDLSAAVTATDLGVANGPGELTAANRLDAAIVATALGKFKRVKAWLADPKKAPADDADAMATRVLLGRRAEVLAVAQACAAPDDRPACDVKPLLRALVAQRAWPEAAHLLELRIQHHEPDLDDVRLALGVADLAQDLPALLKWSQMLAKLRPDDASGWQTAARTHAALGHGADGVVLLLGAPESVAKLAESQELVVALLDGLMDPLAPQALDIAAIASLTQQVQASTTTVGRLAQALLEGWRGDSHAAEHLAALPEGQSQPTLLALRAMALLAAGMTDKAEPLRARAVELAPTDPRAAELALLWAIAQAKPTADAQNAYEDAETKSARVGAAFRMQRSRVAEQIRAWGLTPLPRWPAWPGARP